MHREVHGAFFEGEVAFLSTPGSHRFSYSQQSSCPTSMTSPHYIRRNIGNIGPSSGRLQSPHFVLLWPVPEWSKHTPTSQKLVGSFPRAAWLSFFQLLSWHEELLTGTLQRGRIVHAYCKGKKCIRTAGQLILNIIFNYRHFIIYFVL